MMFQKLYKFTWKKRGRFIRNQTFFAKNKQEVIEFRRFSTFSIKNESRRKINDMLTNT